MKNNLEKKYESIIEELDGRTLRTFLLELVQKNEAAGRFLLERFDEAPEEDPAGEILNRLKALEERYEISKPMDYGKTCRFLEEVMTFLRKEVSVWLQRAETEKVLTACLLLAETLGKARMEQEGELDSIGIRLYDTLKRMTHTEQNRERMSRKLSDFCRREADNPLHAWLEEFLREELEDTACLERAVNELKFRLKACAGREVPWFAPYHGREDAGKKSVIYLKKLGKTKEEILDFLEETKQAPAIRRIQIRMLAEEGKTEEASALLERWIEEENDPFTVKGLEQFRKSLQEGYLGSGETLW